MSLDDFNDFCKDFELENEELIDKTKKKYKLLNGTDEFDDLNNVNFEDEFNALFDKPKVLSEASSSIKQQNDDELNRFNLNKFNSLNKPSVSSTTSTSAGVKVQSSISYAPRASKCFKRKNEDMDEEDEKTSKVEQMDIDPSVLTPQQGSSGSFKTAKEQLEIDQFKKNAGQVQQQSNATTNNGPVAKKTLGNSRRGINSKFSCPFKQQNTDEKKYSSDNLSSNSDAEIDMSKMKNCEPKLIEIITSEVMDQTPAITWDTIAGLQFVKNTIQEIVVWPMLRPDIFSGLRGPPKGLLLFGPPGTGKTLLAKCIANESQSKFFNISSSTLTSKWQGESEKLVRVLFEVARSMQPAVIFIDEIDSLLSQRSDDDRESSRRLKTEFFVQMDGARTSGEERILVIGATNRPQELDDAARRRFVKRLYVPLPEYEGRVELVRNLIKKEKSDLDDDEIDRIAQMTDGYSGADLTNLCREAALGPIRSIKNIKTIDLNQVRPIIFKDFTDAMNQVKASVSQDDLQAYYKWNSTFGSVAIQ